MVLNPMQSLLLALVCLLLGALLNRKLSILDHYNIPAPITGGLLFSAVSSAAIAFGGLGVSLNTVIKPVLLLMFFGGVGMSADLRLLRRGGKTLLVFLALLFPFIVLQNIAGVAVASMLDLHPVFGLVVGSVTLVGGHGTGAAYAERFAEVHNLQSVMELSMTAATVGLIIGGIAAGPVAQFLISRHRLVPVAAAVAVGDAAAPPPALSTLGMLGSLAGILCAVVGGQWLAAALTGLPFTIPSFLWCMVIGVAIRNLAPLAGTTFDDKASELVSGVCLSLFLVMTMMTLNLVEVALSAGPLLVILLAQALVMTMFAVFVCFRVMGRDYEAAVSTAAFMGFSMGSTATAIANMQAITARHGPAPMAFLVVPLAGAFFVDLMNAGILTAFLSLDWLGG